MIRKNVYVLVSLIVLTIFTAGCRTGEPDAPTPITQFPLQSETVLGSSGGDPEQHDLSIYQAVVNWENQYSIWPAYKEVPSGWNSTGFIGSKQACLQYIQDTWTDMRPPGSHTPAPPTPHLTKYQILVNPGAAKLKYVIWHLPAADGIPFGYSVEGHTGNDTDCMVYIQARNPK